MKLPNFNRLIQFKRKITPFIVNHRILIPVSIIISFSVVIFSVWAINVRNNFIASIKSPQKDSSIEVNYSVTPYLSIPNFNDLSSSDSSVLGLSDFKSPNVVKTYTPPVVTPYSIPTDIPLPTYTPISTSDTSSSSSSSSSCAGTPTVDNSQVYVSSRSTLVNNAVTISVELRDCYNNFAPVDDSLTITLSNSDSSARINGSPSPVTIKAQNGKASFSVNSQNVGTDTFVITDTNRSFTVTEPGYHNPSVTFTNNSSGNSNCTTGAGVPNPWYSDVYPASPVSANAGSNVTFSVVIRDCNKQTAAVSDTLSISLNSGDSSTRVSGNTLPYSLTTQNGEASFTVFSQNAWTVALTVQDTTSKFKVTDTNNNNPSVVFSSSSTPKPTDAITPIPQSTDTPTPTLAETATPTPTPTDTLTPIPTSSN